MQNTTINASCQPLGCHCDERGVYWLTLCRPQRANALNGELVAQLTAIFNQIREDGEARLVVITGEGSVFSGGADLAEMQNLAKASPACNRQDALGLAVMLEVLANLPVPTLARVNGAAYGGALGLIAACDIAVACESANFAFSEVKLGLSPFVITPYVLDAIGPRQTRRWFLSGECFSGEQARGMGLVHKLSSSDTLDAAVEEQVDYLLRGGPQAQRRIKQWLNDWHKGESVSTYDCAERLADIRASEEAQEGLQAFHDKRLPGWVKSRVKG